LKLLDEEQHTDKNLGRRKINFVFQRTLLFGFVLVKGFSAVACSGAGRNGMQRLVVS
jgi:hypothetical protein